MAYPQDPIEDNTTMYSDNVYLKRIAWLLDEIRAGGGGGGPVGAERAVSVQTGVAVAGTITAGKKSVVIFADSGVGTYLVQGGSIDSSFEFGASAESGDTLGAITYDPNGLTLTIVTVG